MQGEHDQPVIGFASGPFFRVLRKGDHANNLAFDQNAWVRRNVIQHKSVYGGFGKGGSPRSCCGFAAHDCSSLAMMRAMEAIRVTRGLNACIGRIAFLPTLRPYSLWAVGHNIAHHGYNNLKDHALSGHDCLRKSTHRYLDGNKCLNVYIAAATLQVCTT